MFRKNAFYLTTALAALTSSSAFADVTASDVWLSVQEGLGMFSDTTVQIGGEATDTGAITVTDLTWVSTQSDIVTTSTIPTLTMTEQGDGSVLITMPDTMSVNTVMTDGFTNLVTTTKMSISNDSLQIIASGAPGAMRYDMTAAQLQGAVDSILEGNVTVPIVANVLMSDLAGTYIMEDGDIRILSSEMTADSADITLDLSALEDGAGFSMTGQIADLATQASMSGPATLNFNDPENDDIRDMSIVGGYTFGAMSYEFAVNDNGSAFDGTATADSGSLDISVENGAMAYDTATQGVAVVAAMQGFPVPLNVTVDEAGTSFAMPLAATDDVVPVNVGINLDQLAVNDEIWAMFDPSEQLPRGPVTLQLAISGLAKLLADFDDPAFGQMAMPIEPQEVTIDQLNIDAVGVQIDGEGSFTFDVTDTTTFPGVPRPEGSAQLTASGVNGLMDSLVNMGLLPQDQVMGARMMMGMFATSTGDDQLSSTVEINGQGHLSVNGQRMR